MRQKNISLAILFMLLISSILMFSSTVESTVGDVLLTNWDDVASGLSNDFTSGYFDVDLISGGSSFKTIDVNDLSPDNSFVIESGASGRGDGYWNLTEPITYIGQINFSLYTTYTGDTPYTLMDFYDSNDNRVIGLKMISNDLFWYDVSTGTYKEDLADSLPTATRRYIVITHLITNQFNISVYNTSFGLIDSFESAGSYASEEGYSNFSYIKFDSEGPAFTIFHYFDDIIINTLSSDGTGGDTEISDFVHYVNQGCGVVGGTSIYSWTEFMGNVRDFAGRVLLYPDAKYMETKRDEKESGTIHYVDLYVTPMQLEHNTNSLNDYTCYVNGESFGHPIAFIEKSISSTTGYFIRFYSASGKLLENEYPLFSFSCSKYYSDNDAYGDWYWFPFVHPHACGWDARKHENIQDLADNELDGVPLTNQFYGSTLWPLGINNCLSPYIEYYYTPLSGDFNTDDNIIEVNKTIMINYRDTYGDPTKDNCFIEFWEGNKECRYRVIPNINSQPQIIFYINDTWLNYGSFYRFQIRHVDNTGDKIVHNGLIRMYNTHEEGIFESTYKFEEDGYYYIVLYNISDANKTIDEVVLESSYITVCRDDKIIPDPIYNPEFSIPNMIRSILDPTTRVLAGLIILGGITFSPFIVSLKLKQKNVTINIPNILYGVMFGVGVVANYVLGFFGVIELFFLLAILITIVALVFYTGKPKATGE